MNFYRVFSYLSSPARPARLDLAPVLWSDLNGQRRRVPPPAVGVVRLLPRDSEGIAERARDELRNGLKRAS